MTVAATIGAVISAAIVMPAYRQYKAWKAYRNGLDDDVRAEIRWNDRRYERLMLAKRIFLWIILAIVGAMAIFTVAIGVVALGNAKGWWHL